MKHSIVIILGVVRCYNTRGSEVLHYLVQVSSELHGIEAPDL